MRRIFSIFFLLFASFLQANDLSMNIVDDSGRISPALLEILEVTKVAHDGTLKGIVEATQKAWLRRPGKERWQLDNRFDEHKEALIPLFKKIGCCQEYLPKQKHYKYAVILGATSHAVEGRLKDLARHSENGTTFETLVFLTGQRPIDHNFETDVPQEILWESDMVKWFFQTLSLPEAIRNLPVIFIDTPRGKANRPNTADTIKLLLSQNPEKGSCLFFSTQPFAGYQDAVIRTEMPEGFLIETIGAETYRDIPTDVHLDNLARWLYQIELLREKSAP